MSKAAPAIASTPAPVVKLPISARQRKLMEQPLIVNQLPASTGELVITEFQGECRQCRQTIPDNCLMGTITYPIKGVMVIEAVGACKACMLLTPFMARYKEDGRIEQLVDNRWIFWYPKKKTWAGKLKSVLRRVIGQK